MSKFKVQLVKTILVNCKIIIDQKIESSGESLKQSVTNLDFVPKVSDLYSDYRAWKICAVTLDQALSGLPSELDPDTSLSIIESLMTDLERGIKGAECLARIDLFMVERLKWIEPIDNFKVAFVIESISESDAPSFDEALKEVGTEGPTGEPAPK